MRDVYAFDVDPDVLPSEFVTLTVDHLFGEVWADESLRIAERRLLTIGVLAAQGQPALLEVQFASALRNGELTVEQIRKLVVHLTHYVGWPLATGIDGAAEKTIAAHQAHQADQA
ncbi:MAG: carboxymuconolactone decarboxylase family protein [Acidimicrobiales bacterium]